MKIFTDFDGAISFAVAIATNKHIELNTKWGSKIRATTYNLHILVMKNLTTESLQLS